MSRVLKLLGVLVFLVALGAVWFWSDANTPYLHSQPPVEVDIAPGVSSRQIARQLQEAGVIRRRSTFLLMHYLRPRKTLKAGFYSFDRRIPPKEVFRQLVMGEVARQEVTIPEGYNRFAIAELVQAVGLVEREEFLKASADTSLIADLSPLAPSLEGYLFPDTYQFPRHSGAVPIVRAMVNRFRQVYSAVRPLDDERSLHEIVTMASLVETETGKDDERAVVASVFYNRLRLGIPLQCDPTVVYAAILQNSYHGTIRQVDLQSNSPYNTYAYAGLPPGPIANPGKASLFAALHPATTKYLYFVANSMGHHTFSRTLAEHNLAVTLYRRSLPR
ncbi:MAG: endolytic transglycosylase MltG [Acidobacteria bacterium]|nr:endolytic transglycosylase MltG [Acidobacteriota bacterium]